MDKIDMKLGMKIIKSLNLPERTRKIVLTFEVGKAPIVQCESFVIEENGVADLLSEYILVKRQDPF